MLEINASVNKKIEKSDFTIDKLCTIVHYLDMPNDATVTSPGAAIQRELDARGWNQYDLAQVLGVNQSLISALITGGRRITEEIAWDLSAAFATEPSYWLKLETDFRLFSTRRPNDDIARRARLFESAPVKELVRRRWIQDTNDIDLLEKQILGFYGVTALDEISIATAYAARKSTSYGETKPGERAWMQRVKMISQMVNANKFSDAGLDGVLAKFQSILKHPESVRLIPKLLSECGVRLVIVEPLNRTRIEGVCLWLDKYSPVIGLSMRIDRLDSLWFTLLHEVWHVKNRDGLLKPAVVDSDLIGENAVASDQKPEAERTADLFAAASLVKPEEMDNFIARVAPLFSRAKIEGFAARLGIHPAIVIGQLHYRRQIPWSHHNRDFTLKVRDIITQSALTDGWGQTLPAAS
jgi:HTH-type transcriptional regulator/antitoxin HigA